VTQIICGVDVSKAKLDAQVAPAGVFQSFGNDAEGIAELVTWCQRHGVELCVMEATGGLEQLAYTLLWAAEVPSAIVNARNVRSFAQAMGFFEKTDRIDAEIIAHYAHSKGVAPGQRPSAEAVRLKALTCRLRQITSDLVVQKQRRSSTRDTMALASLNELIGLLKQQQTEIADAIAGMIEADPLWAKLDTAFRTIKGVAGRTVAYLMTEVAEIGTLSNKAISKIVGLAPLADDSGKRSGQRHIRGGRAGVRSILFLVAQIAAKYDPELNAFQQRLLAAGKPKMVVRIALAHKLIVRLNAKARDARKEFAMQP
jgi:transposase